MECREDEIKEFLSVVMCWGFRPVRWLHFSIWRWSEHVCDRKACEYAGDYMFVDTKYEYLVEVKNRFGKDSVNNISNCAEGLKTIKGTICWKLCFRAEISVENESV